jgi:hypothetical protein
MWPLQVLDRRWEGQRGLKWNFKFKFIPVFRVCMTISSSSWYTCAAVLRLGSNQIFPLLLLLLLLCCAPSLRVQVMLMSSGGLKVAWLASSRLLQTGQVPWLPPRPQLQQISCNRPLLSDRTLQQQQHVQQLPPQRQQQPLPVRQRACLSLQSLACCLHRLLHWSSCCIESSFWKSQHVDGGWCSKQDHIGRAHAPGRTFIELNLNFIALSLSRLAVHDAV